MNDVIITDSFKDNLILRYSFIWGIYAVNEPYESRNYAIINKVYSAGRSCDCKPYNCTLGEYISNYNPSDLELMDFKLIQLKILEDEFDLL